MTLANTEDGTSTMRTSPSVGSGFSQVGLKKSDNLDNVTKDIPEDEGKVHMKRRVGLISGTALIVGTMIGEYVIYQTLSTCFNPSHLYKHFS